jgi:hypothetical protein
MRLAMPTTQESKARTRAFARVIGPLLIVVPTIVAAHAQEMDAIVTVLFEHRELVWAIAGLLVFSGSLIIAYHQYWSSPSAVFISVLGWLLALRGVALLAVPQLMARDADGAMIPFPGVRLGYGVLFLVGIWLTFVGWTAEPDAAPATDRESRSLGL